MLHRVAASWVAVLLLIAWPVRSGVDNGTLADFKAAAEAPSPDAPIAAATGAPVIDAAVTAVDRAARAADESPAASSKPQPSPTAVAREAAPPVSSPSAPISEPFGLAAVPVTGGELVAKWAGVEADIRAGNEILARCRVDAVHCPQAAKDFLAIVAQGQRLTGRTRIGVINRAVNLAIEPESDLAQWGVPDRWSAPLETFSTGRGDCEDYAIAKYVALTAAGIAAADVRLVVVRNTAVNEDHAVAAVRVDGDWIVLDNRWLTLVAAADMPKAIPLFVLDETGVRQFAVPAIAARQAAAPASF